MGMVVAFRDRHGRASAEAVSSTGRARAARRVSMSDVTPASLAVEVAKRAAHQSDGTLSRCHHFETREAVAPMSAAHASRVRQRSSTARNEPGSEQSVMLEPLGHLVLKNKPLLSRDCGERGPVKSEPMNEQAASQFRERFIAAVKRAREVKFTQEKIAELLDMPQDKYKQYESRSLLPHYLVSKFCIACGISPDDLYESAKQPAVAAKPRRRKVSKAA